MPESEFVRIASYATEFEADTACSLLRENGIHAFVEGGATNTMLSYVGSALGGVRLLTSSGNSQAAIELLAGVEDDSRTSEAPWFCGECAESNEANFEICWACGQERKAVEGQFPSPVADAEHGSRLDADAKSQAVFTKPSRAQSNPYVSPGVAAAPASQASQSSATNEVDEMVLRAYRAAVLGFILLPVITHAYALYLLLRVASQTGNLSTVGNGLWMRAFAITTVGCLMWLTMFAMIVSF